jgi:hypothetical protein
VTERRFPPPWSVEEQSACFVVRNHNGWALDYQRRFPGLTILSIASMRRLASSISTRCATPAAARSPMKGTTRGRFRIGSSTVPKARRQFSTVADGGEGAQ